MTSIRSLRRFYTSLALVFAGLGSACGESDPLALGDQPVVLMGRVASVATLGESSPAAVDGGLLLEGIEVSVEGSASTTTTDASGNFRLAIVAGESTIVLRFRRGVLDARIEIDGVAPGSTVRFDVSLTGVGGTILRRDGDAVDFHGRAAFVELVGDAPARTLRVELVSETRSMEIEILEGLTVFQADGDIHTLADLIVALDRADLTVRIEGEGEARDDGSVVATSVTVETDEHADAPSDDANQNDDDAAPQAVEFRGLAALVSVSGSAPTRTVLVQVAGDHGSWLVELVEGDTSFDASGDFQSVGSIAAALDVSGLSMRIEGVGTAFAGGAVVAATARAEID